MSASGTLGSVCVCESVCVAARAVSPLCEIGSGFWLYEPGDRTSLQATLMFTVTFWGAVTEVPRDGYSETWECV